MGSDVFGRVRMRSVFFMNLEMGPGFNGSQENETISPLSSPDAADAASAVGIYYITRVLPSISIDDGILRHCSLVAFAESSDYFNGHGWATMASACTAIWLHLQKFWIGFDGFGTAFWLD